MSEPQYPEATRPVVIYADHDPAGRDAFARACSGDHEVVTCVDASSALVAFDMHEVAVLVTVLHMPGLTGEDLLRIVRDVYPRTVRIAVGGAADAGQLARASDDGLVARTFVAPWHAAELVEALRSACHAWTPAVAPAVKTRSVLHDVRSVLMSILANAEHLEALAEDAPALSRALARLMLPPQTKHDLARLLDELLPLARDLTTASRELKQLLERLRE